MHRSAVDSALFASATGVGACPLAATVRFRSTLLHLLGDRSGRYGSVYYDLVIRNLYWDSSLKLLLKP